MAVGLKLINRIVIAPRWCVHFPSAVLSYLVRIMVRIFFALYLMTLSLFLWAQAESECYGDPNNGSLKNGWQLPDSGENFHAYSSIGVLAGRNFVHSKVYRIVLDAYEILQKTNPNVIYVYGETGFKGGGLFRPHKSHRNGLSVDFFVPVIDSKGVPAELDIGVSNKLGYNLEFDSKGRIGELSIDFESIAKHLDALLMAAKNQRSNIDVVIFDPRFQVLLQATPTGAKIKNKIRFSMKKPWVRHDEHYHVNFMVPCLALNHQ